MRKFYLIGVCLLAAVLFGCHEGEHSNEADMEVIVGNEELRPPVQMRTVTDGDYDRTDGFEAILRDSQRSIPYAELGQSVSIQLEGKAPDTYELRDYVLNKEGKQKYKGQHPQIQELEWIKGSGRFTLTTNPMALLSSDSKDYERAAVLRGFKLIGKWGERQQEFDFIVRTDAYGQSTQ